VLFAVMLALGTVVAAGGSVAQGAPRPAQTPSALPPGVPGELSGVAAVPHSSDLWVFGQSIYATVGYLVGRWHGGHWQSVKAPKLGGRYGELDAVAAGSASSISASSATNAWAVGSVYLKRPASRSRCTGMASRGLPLPPLPPSPR
jgi:hypothetical protein